MENFPLIKSLDRYVQLDDQAKQYFQSILLTLPVKQNDFIETTGKVSRYFINVNKGCLMTYYTDSDDNDHVIQFASPGWWTGDLQSFTKATPGIYSTRALVDSEVLLLPKAEMDELLEQFPKFEKYFRIIFQNSLITHQQRIIRNLSMSAEGRYQYFLEKYPTLEQFVPQKYIASYLGITPEFLSKIRRKLMER